MNDKVKSLFFSQYLGHELIVTSVPENVNYPNYPFDINEGGLFLSGILGSQIIVRRIAEDVKDRFNQTSLLLRDISQLTGEEYSVLAKWSAYRLDEKNIVKVGKSMAKHLLELNSWSGNGILQMTDYLRSIGILLSFTYFSETNQPITLTPAEIIALGWAKPSIK